MAITPGDEFVSAEREQLDAMSNEELRLLANRIGLSLDGVTSRVAILAILIQSAESAA